MRSRTGAETICLVPPVELIDARHRRRTPLRSWDLFTSLYRPTESAASQRASGTWNGVATFARAGLTLRADPAPLVRAARPRLALATQHDKPNNAPSPPAPQNIPDLDSEGRCLLTDHVSFVLFNVYVHAVRGRRARGSPDLP